MGWRYVAVLPGVTLDQGLTGFDRLGGIKLKLEKALDGKEAVSSNAANGVASTNLVECLYSQVSRSNVSFVESRIGASCRHMQANREQRATWKHEEAARIKGMSKPRMARRRTDWQREKGREPCIARGGAARC